MAEFAYYQCVLNSDHPKKKVPCYALVKPYCCGKPMVKVTDSQPWIQEKAPLKKTREIAIQLESLQTDSIQQQPKQ